MNLCKPNHRRTETKRSMPERHERVVCDHISTSNNQSRNFPNEVGGGFESLGSPQNLPPDRAEQGQGEAARRCGLHPYQNGLAIAPGAVSEA